MHQLDVINPNMIPGLADQHRALLKHCFHYFEKMYIANKSVDTDELDYDILKWYAVTQSSCVSLNQNVSD